MSSRIAKIWFVGISFVALGAESYKKKNVQVSAVGVLNYEQANTSNTSASEDLAMLQDRAPDYKPVIMDDDYRWYHGYLSCTAPENLGKGQKMTLTDARDECKRRQNCMGFYYWGSMHGKVQFADKAKHTYFCLSEDKVLSIVQSSTREWTSYVRLRASAQLGSKVSFPESRSYRKAEVASEFEEWAKANEHYFDGRDAFNNREPRALPSTVATECDDGPKQFTRTLFDKINQKIVGWEIGNDMALKCPQDKRPLDTTKWPGDKPDVVIVYGGRPPRKSECSDNCQLKPEHWHRGTYSVMPSALVAALRSLLPDKRVYSISHGGSDIAEGNPLHLHVEGVDLSLDLSRSSKPILEHIDYQQHFFRAKKILVIMTFADYKTPDESLGNIRAARNVGKDLQKLRDLQPDDIHVVLTGTDATNQPHDINRQCTIMPRNYHYALSKIAQGFVLEHSLTEAVKGTVKEAVVKGADVKEAVKGTVKGTDVKGAVKEIEAVKDNSLIKAVGEIETLIEIIGRDVDSSSVAKSLDGMKSYDEISDDYKVNGVGLSTFGKEMCRFFKNFKFEKTTIIQIGVMLTDLHVPKKCMVEKEDSNLENKGTNWIERALSVIISPQYAAMKHLTYEPGRITD